MAIGFLEWNQRNNHTERRTFWPNLWGGGWVVSRGVTLVCLRWHLWERHASWTAARTERQWAVWDGH